MILLYYTNEKRRYNGMTFGEKIQSLRKQSGLSQEELSYRLGVSRQAVSKWERNSGYPETEKLIKMSKLFNVTIDLSLIHILYMRRSFDRYDG